MLRRIKYTCKNCGWSKQIPEQWADLKPRRCGNHKCNTSFLLDKDKLDILRPEKAKKPKPAPKVQTQEKKDEEVKSSYKSKRSSKIKQQSFKKQEEKQTEDSE